MEWLAVLAVGVGQLLVRHQIQGELSICRQLGERLRGAHDGRVGEATERARHHQADGVAAGAGQALGRPVGDVVVLGGRLAHSRARRDRDLGAVTQR